MSCIKAVYTDVEQCCEMFLKGIELLDQCQVEASIDYFGRAMRSTTEGERYFYKCQSYHALASLLSGCPGALEVCRSAAVHYPFDGDICMNRARAEIFVANRVKALQSIETGLRFSHRHRGLLELRKRMGVRSRKPLPVLSRSHLLNRALGKMLRQKK